VARFIEEPLEGNIVPEMQLRGAKRRALKSGSGKLLEQVKGSRRSSVGGVNNGMGGRGQNPAYTAHERAPGAQAIEERVPGFVVRPGSSELRIGAVRSVYSMPLGYTATSASTGQVKETSARSGHAPEQLHVHVPPAIFIETTDIQSELSPMRYTHERDGRSSQPEQVAPLRTRIAVLLKALGSVGPSEYATMAEDEDIGPVAKKSDFA
jgi:hypothetical protein